MITAFMKNMKIFDHGNSELYSNCLCSVFILITYKCIVIIFMHIAGLNVNQQENGNTSVKAGGIQQSLPEDSSNTGGIKPYVHVVVLLGGIDNNLSIVEHSMESCWRHVYQCLKIC